MANPQKPRKKLTVKETPIVPEIPKDLLDLWSSVEACATVSNLLHMGAFQFNTVKAVYASINFVAELYNNCVDKCLIHPQCDMIPELKKIKEQKAREEIEKKVQAEIAAKAKGEENVQTQ